MDLPPLPYKVLIGPLYNPGVLGNYLCHPQVRWFHAYPLPDHDPAFIYNITETTFADIIARLPFADGWEPDVIVWWDLIYQAVPIGIEDCPYPTAVIVGDWNIHFLASRIYTTAFDFIFGDRKLIQFLHQVGIYNCEYWPGFSFEPEKHKRLPDTERIYDVTFVGNLNHRVQQERGAYLERLALLADQYQIHIVGGVHGPDYTRLLNQSKMVFNYSIRSEMNMRAYEAPACGALLLMEDSNLEIRDFLTDGESCVLYNTQNLEDKIHYYLAHEEERLRIAEAGYQAIQNHSYEKQFGGLVPLLSAAIERFQHRQPRVFVHLPDWQRQLCCVRQIYRANTPESTNVAFEIVQETAQFNPIPERLEPGQAEMLNMLGKLLLDPFYLHLYSTDDPLRTQSHQALHHAAYVFEHLSPHCPENPIVCYNLGVVEMTKEAFDEALAAFSQALAFIETEAPLNWWFDVVQPQAFKQRFLVEWERCLAWDLLENSPDLARTRALLSWQIHEYCGRIYTMQGQWESAAQSYQQAIAQCPFLGETEYYLAQSYVHLKRYADAIAAFERALEKQPFMVDAWLEYADLLLQQYQFAKAVAFLTHKLPVLQVNESLAAERIQFAEALRKAHLGHALSQSQPLHDYLLSTFDLYAFAEIQQWSAVVASPAVQQKWSLLTCVWQPLWPEPRCILDPQTGFSFAETPPTDTSLTIWIGYGEANPPIHFHRSYHQSTHLSQGVIGPDRLPLFFPVGLLLEPIELVDTSQFNLLVLVDDWQNPALQHWIHAFESGLGHRSDVACVLWNPLHPPQPTELAQIQHWSSTESQAPLTVLEESLSITQSHTLLHQCQIIAGTPIGPLSWLLGWALFQGIPVWLWQQPTALFPPVSQAQWEPWLRPIDTAGFATLHADWPLLQQETQELTDHIAHFYQYEAQQYVLDLLWELRLQLL